MSENKYWVPAIERADKIINIIANHPGEYRLIDLSNELNINKSSLFSLLNTLEVLNWVEKKMDGTYSLGMKLGLLSPFYFKQFDLISSFNSAVLSTVEKVDETIQLSIIDGTDIVYLAKKEGSSPVRVATEPGMKFPAHATAMGKVQLSQYTYQELKDLYPSEKLIQRTEHTVKTVNELWEQILSIQEYGFINEYQEAVISFNCIAAPIINHENKIIGGVSVTILSTNWDEKHKIAQAAIVDLAHRISLKAGYLHPVKQL